MKGKKNLKKKKSNDNNNNKKKKWKLEKDIVLILSRTKIVLIRLHNFGGNLMEFCRFRNKLSSYLLAY